MSELFDKLDAKKSRDSKVLGNFISIFCREKHGSEDRDVFSIKDERVAECLGDAEMLKMNYSDVTTSDGKAVSVILRGAEKASALTKQLLDFARKNKYKKAPLNINEVIQGTLMVSEKIFEMNIEVGCEFCENIYTVEADRNQMDQVKRRCTNYLFP